MWTGIPKKEEIIMHVIGLDVGTTGLKAIVFDLEGKIKGYGFGRYDIIFKKPNWAEQDPEKLWEIARNVIRKVIKDTNLKDIKAICVSVQGDAVIPVDSKIRPLHNAILGMDYRSVKEALSCSELIGGRELFNITGMRPHPITSLTKILWFKENTKDIYKESYKFMTYADFISSKLGAQPYIDWTMASRTMAFDLLKREWSEFILDKVNINKSLFSKPVPSGEIIGKVSTQVAEDVGLSEECLIITGGHDQTCAGIGAGCIKEGIAIDSHGTAEVLSTAFIAPVLNDDMYESYYPCYLHAKKGMYFTFSLNHVGGILLEWYKDTMGYFEEKEAQKLGRDIYQLIDSKTKEGPSKLLILPHFNGSGTPWCDLSSKGAILGLTLSSTRHDISKAILDSLVYELRINMERMRKAGIKIKEVRAVGGAAKSPIWLRVKADILDCKIMTLETHEAACLGAAIIAGTAIGGYSSLEEGVKIAVKPKDEFTPNPEMQELYEERYNIYKDLYVTLKDINRRL